MKIFSSSLIRELDGYTIDFKKAPYHYTERQDIASLLRTRNRFSYKNNFGHALIVAGSKGKMGAAILCAKSCLRSGAGLITAHLPACGENSMQTAFPEAMVRSDKENDFISDVDDIDSYSVVGIGPGIGTNEKTVAALEKLLSKNPKSLVLDADALNIISLHKGLIPLIPPNTVLTPHPGEFDRLAGKSDSSYERLQKAREWASSLRCVIVLKGAYTAVCTPDKAVCFNSSGNPGMATAGSGDVLTGMITGLLAQGYSPTEAAKIGVYIHGLAGDLATENGSQESLIASDIIDNIGKAFMSTWRHGR
jgi:NAD(P)H-hydrate epimerase